MAIVHIFYAQIEQAIHVHVVIISGVKKNTECFKMEWKRSNLAVCGSVGNILHSKIYHLKVTVG